MESKVGEILVTKECLCARYVHESTNYPRPGLEKLKHEFKVGDTHSVEEEFTNFYGSYYRVKIDGRSHDIPKNNVEILSMKR